jgi:hypothetical protein
MSIENIVEVSWKELKIIDSAALVKVLEKLKMWVTQTVSLGEIFKNYINKFQGKANLWESARIINRDLENASKGDIRELARKLDLTTITGAQENKIASDAYINPQAKITTAELASPQQAPISTPTPTAQNKGFGRIGDYSWNNSLQKRMDAAGV